MIGTWIQSVAFMWLAYRISGSTWFTGLIGFLASAPHLFLTPLAGVLGDRVNRRKLLITVLSAMAVVSVVLALVSGLDLVSMPALAAVAFITGVCSRIRDSRPRNRSSSSFSTTRKTCQRSRAQLGPDERHTAHRPFHRRRDHLRRSGKPVCFVINAVSYTAVVGALMD
jgi:hypothetical protein